MRRRVVLVGGGYVTLHAYAQLVRRLDRQLRDGAIELVIVSAEESHGFHGFTGEVLAGQVAFGRTRTPLAVACPRARLIHGRVVSVDATRRTIVYHHEGSAALRSLPYDELVVGTGGREPVGRVPGLRDHGYTLRGPGDIEALAARVTTIVAEAAASGPASAPASAPASTSASEPPPDTGALTVVVAGGGLAGVELAAALAGRGAGLLRVHLVHSGGRLVPELDDQPGLARRATDELDRLGVHVHLGVRLSRVTAERAELSDGRSIAASTVVGTIGQHPVGLPGLERRRHDACGRLTTSRDLGVTDGVWAAGDAARVLHPVTGEPVPANALWAIKAGAHAGANAARRLRGQATRPFRYRGLGRAASFGLGRAVAELYGIPFTGRLAWLLRLTFFLRFMPSRRQAARVVLDLARSARRPGASVGVTLAQPPAQPGRARVPQPSDLRAPLTR